MCWRGCGGEGREAHLRDSGEGVGTSRVSGLDGEHSALWPLLPVQLGSGGEDTTDCVHSKESSVACRGWRVETGRYTCRWRTLGHGVGRRAQGTWWGGGHGVGRRAWDRSPHTCSVYSGQETCTSTLHYHTTLQGRRSRSGRPGGRRTNIFDSRGRGTPWT